MSALSKERIENLLGNASPQSSASSRARQAVHCQTIADSFVPCGMGHVSGPRLELGTEKGLIGTRAKQSIADMRSQAELGTEGKQWSRFSAN